MYLFFTAHIVIVILVATVVVSIITHAALFAHHLSNWIVKWKINNETTKLVSFSISVTVSGNLTTHVTQVKPYLYLYSWT